MHTKIVNLMQDLKEFQARPPANRARSKKSGMLFFVPIFKGLASNGNESSLHHKRCILHGVNNR